MTSTRVVWSNGEHFLSCCTIHCKSHMTHIISKALTTSPFTCVSTKTLQLVLSTCVVVPRTSYFPLLHNLLQTPWVVPSFTASNIITFYLWVFTNTSKLAVSEIPNGPYFPIVTQFTANLKQCHHFQDLTTSPSTCERSLTPPNLPSLRYLMDTFPSLHNLLQIPSNAIISSI